MDLIDKYIGEKKGNKNVDMGILDQKKVFRIPTAKASQFFKDKKKYNRKQKHKIKY